MRVRAFLLIASCVAVQALASPASAGGTFTYEGYLTDTSSIPVSGARNFQAQIFGHSNGIDCLLYTESQAVTLSTGNFSFAVGAGSSVTNYSGGTFSQLFRSNVSVTGQSCTFDPTRSDARWFLRLALYDNGAYVTMSDVDLTSAPNAMQAESINGFSIDNLLRVSDGGVPGTAAALTSTQFAELTALIGGSSTQYINSNGVGAILPVISANSGASEGEIWFDGGSHQLMYNDGTTNRAVGVSGALETVGSGGTGTKVTYDTYGRVTGTTALVQTDLPQITGAGMVLGDAITSGTIGGSTAVSTSGNISAGNMSAGNGGFKTVEVWKPDNSNKVTLSVPATLAANYTLSLPVSQGTTGQILSANGTGGLVWTAPSAGTVTSVSVSAPLTGGGSSTASIGIPKATGSVDGFLAATDFATFSGKLGTTSAFNGDVSGTATNISVDKLKGVSVAITSIATGNYLKYNGTSWVNTMPSSADLADAGSLIKSSQMPANCSSGQTLTFSSPTGTWTCSNITVTGSAFGSQAQSAFFIGPASGSGSPTFRTISTADLPSGLVSASGTTNAIPYFTGTSALGTSPLFVSSGNVGVGTSSPDAPFSIANTGTAPQLTLKDLSHLTNSGSAQALIVGEDSAGAQIWRAGAPSSGSAIVFGGVDAYHPLQLLTKNLTRAQFSLDGSTTFSGNSGPQLVLQNSSSTVNSFSIAGSQAGSGPLLTVQGTDTNADIQIQPKGSGKVSVLSALAIPAGSSYIIGTQSALSVASSNVSVGPLSASTSSGTANTAVGNYALANTTGNSNTAVGMEALRFMTSASNNTAVGTMALRSATGSYNTALGYGAGQSGGQAGTFVGFNAGGNASGNGNTIVGYYAATTLVSGTNNVVLGSNAAGTLQTGSNNIVIGANADIDASDSARLNIGSAIFGDISTPGTPAIGIGVDHPRATLDINGYMKLKPNSAPPVACSSTTAGVIALTSAYAICVCNGTTWNTAAGAGGPACIW